MPSSLAAFNTAAEALWARLHAAWPGLDVEVAAHTDSTSTRLLERARQGLEGPCVLAALEQSAGRGRLGRSWQAQAGASLTFSVALPWPPRAGGVSAAPADAGGLSIAVGVAVAETLHDNVLLKWPNDLCIKRPAGLAKLGGILIETVSSGTQLKAVVIGIGVNVEASSVPDLAALHAAAGSPLPPSSLDTLQPGVTAAQVFEALVPAVLDAADRLATRGLAPMLERYALRDALAGQAVQILLPQAGGGSSVLTEGRATGLDEQGRLLVHTAAGLQAVCSGEVSVRPTPAH